ncbi:ribokinase [Mediterraneibacter agrestimuris]|uniref:ribokinase n=1 Tax=Mediterraneibacter agrestimuris TaxID=2941333 RepID=UPI002041E188|nr:ribokinase [Mediterraneibacter agrestimuris]
MKIAIVGSMNMDMILHADRIPLKGETIHGKSIEYQPGGKGANQAAAIAKLGGDVTMFGCVGNDAAGRQLIDNLMECGVNTSYIEILENVPTGQAVIMIGESDNSIIIIAGANDRVDISYVEKHRKEILEADIVVLQNEIPEETVWYTIRMCHEENKIIVWNPAPARKAEPEIIDMVTYITPNEHEVGIIWEKKPEEIADLQKQYREKLIVTQGEKGVSVSADGEQITTIPAMQVEVVDTTGAGDTLNGAFCVGIADGMDEIQALGFANVAAGLSVKKCGAQKGMPCREEVEEIVAVQRRALHLLQSP